MSSPVSILQQLREPSDELIPEAQAALLKEPSVYVSRGKLVQLIDDGKRTRLKPLNWSGLCAVLSKNKEWHAFLTLFLQQRPPGWLPRHLLENETWPELRPIAGTTDVPVLRPDGTLLSEPGYDAQTGLYYSPRLMLDPIPAEPTPEDAKSAANDLSKLLDVFPAVSKAHRSALLSAFMTPFASLAVDGPSPLFLLDQPGEGNVATTAADAIGLLVSGRPMARLEKPATERRLRKVVAQLDAPGEATLLLEGAHKLIDPAPLSTALESTRWIDGADEPEQRQRLVWYAHASNATLSRATAELTLPIRFFDTDDDFAGSTFAWPSGFRSWLMTNRARFVRSILILLRAYIHAEKPAQSGEPWSRFGAWRSLIGGALIWAGLDDPLMARRSLAAATENDEWPLIRALIVTLFQVMPKEGMTTEDILLSLGGEAWGHVRSVLADIFGTEKPDARQLGNLLRAHRGRVVGGHFVHRSGTAGAGFARWSIERIPKLASSVARPPPDVILRSLTDPICDYPERPKTPQPSESDDSDSVISEKAIIPTEPDTTEQPSQSIGPSTDALSTDALSTDALSTDALECSSSSSPSSSSSGGLGRLAPDESEQSESVTLNPRIAGSRVEPAMEARAG